jgi:hypothetical protein
MQLETVVAVKSELEIRDICGVCVYRECVEARLVARGDAVGGHETLAAVGTLFKGGERFLEI